MNFSKKLLSVVLAFVMLFSVATVFASAYTVGAEDANSINIKYTVEKVSEVSLNDGSSTYTGDDIYAVKVFAKALRGIDTLTVPVHFNNEHFAPILYIEEGVPYPGAEKDMNSSWATDFGLFDVYKKGEFLNNTNMYKADGTVTTSNMSAKAYGRGNAKATAVAYDMVFYSPDHTLYSKWHAGLSDTTGVISAVIDGAGHEKNTFLNVVSGLTINTDYTEMLTVYFLRIAATDAECVGDEFGVYTDSCYTVDGTVNATEAGFYTAPTTLPDSSLTNIPKNVVSNAVIEEQKEPSPVFNKNSQIRFNAAPVGNAKADFDVRTRGYISADDLTALCGGNVTEGAITDVGFVYFPGEGMNLATALAVAKNGSEGKYTRYQCKYMQATGSEYVWTCMVTDPVHGDPDLYSVAYITVDGETYITDAAQKTSFADLYDRNIDSYLGA